MPALPMPPRLTAKPSRSIERDEVVLQLDDGRQIQVQRVRDPRARRIRLSVDERGVRLTLPLRASALSGERFLHQHRQWVQIHLDQQLGQEPLPALVPWSTATLPLRGQDVAVQWQQSRYAAIQYEHACITFQCSPGLTPASLRQHLRRFYETQARADIHRWLPRYLAALPCAPAPIRLKMMSSLWGSLSADGAMTLDLSLIIAPPSAFEYVLVHELCHLIHANHSPAFWREVQARFPTWREERGYFHQQGRRLKARLRALLTEA